MDDTVTEPAVIEDRPVFPRRAGTISKSRIAPTETGTFAHLNADTNTWS